MQVINGRVMVGEEENNIESFLQGLCEGSGVAMPKSSKVDDVVETIDGLLEYLDELDSSDITDAVAFSASLARDLLLKDKAELTMVMHQQVAE